MNTFNIARFSRYEMGPTPSPAVRPSFCAEFAPQPPGVTPPHLHTTAAIFSKSWK